MRLAVLDIGSNTVHLLIVDAHHGGAPLPESKMSRPLRLAEHLLPDGSIDAEAADALVGFVAEGLRLAEDRGASEVMAFATSAIRDASNGESILARIADRTGQSVRILSGVDEARMTFLAVRRWFGWSTGRLLVLDIGGGSLEAGIGRDEEPDVAISLPLGAGRLTRSHLAGDPPSADAIRDLRRLVRTMIAGEAGRLLRSGTPSMAAATSKTFRQLARIAGAAPSSDGMYVRRTLTLAAVEGIVTKAAGMSARELADLPGVSQGRAGQLLAGAIVAEAAMDLLGIGELVICPWALREGLILNRMDGMPA